MPQDLTFDFPFSVVDMVLMGRLSLSPWRTVEHRGLGAARRFGCGGRGHGQTDVTHLANRMVGTLSAGERQRVLARASPSPDSLAC